MKKVFLIVVLFIFYISNAYADKEYLKNFNKFLSNNKKFISENGIKGLKFINICKEEKNLAKNGWNMNVNSWLLVSLRYKII